MCEKPAICHNMGNELAIMQIQKIPNINIPVQNTYLIWPPPIPKNPVISDKKNWNTHRDAITASEIRIMRFLPHFPAAYPIGIADSADAMPTMPAAKGACPVDTPKVFILYSAT